MAQVVNFGGGVNSTAMLIGMHERRESVDLIVFADTGGERPETYKHVDRMSSWLVERGLPKIETTRWIRQDGRFVSLEQNCLDRHELPSLAYGFKGCSVKWKAQPIDKLVRKRLGTRGVVRCIGFDAGESRRAKPRPDSEWEFRYPLIEWNWGRDECLLAIDRAGAPVPSKSSCFFCPASTRREVLALRASHPDLWSRALALEAGAEAHTVKGLGRHWAWSQAARQEDSAPRLFPEIACDCFDGEEDARAAAISSKEEDGKQ